MKQKKISSSTNKPGTSKVLEDILGCKWTVVVIRSIASGTRRPGELSKGNPGLSPKVLNQRLRKLQKFAIISRRSFNQIPPKVEYQLTPLGKRIAQVLNDLDKIDLDLMKG